MNTMGPRDGRDDGGKSWNPGIKFNLPFQQQSDSRGRLCLRFGRWTGADPHPQERDANAGNDLTHVPSLKASQNREIGKPRAQ